LKEQEVVILAVVSCKLWSQ